MVGTTKTFNLLHSKVVQNAAKLPPFISAYKDSRTRTIQLGKQHEPMATATPSSSENLEDRIILLSEQATTPMSLKALYKFGDNPSPETFLKSAQFLHRELPIRFAQRVIQLGQLPYGLSQLKPVKDTTDWYKRIIHEFSRFPAPSCPASQHKFSCLLASVNLDLNSMPLAVARAMQEWRKENGFDRAKWQKIDESLDRIFMQRLASTTLIDHYISAIKSRSGFAGLIQKNCSAFEVVEQVSQNVHALSEQALGKCPEIIVVGSQERFTYVPSHLFFIMNELLKNSARAVIEQHNKTLTSLPPIKVIVSKGEEDVSIKIEDEGGGIRRSDLDYIWSYNFSTATTPTEILTVPSQEDVLTFGTLRCERTALYGYGMGLPLSRLHARYFGGDLHLESMEGYGTDAYVHIPCLGVKSENLASSFFRTSLFESRNGYYYAGNTSGKSASQIFDPDLLDARRKLEEEDSETKEILEMCGSG